MARRKQSRGDCIYCGKEYTGSGLTNHLKTCKARQEAIQQADKEGMAVQPIYHLAVRTAWSSSYWLHLEMNGSADLAELDQYLRTIWLECCGHMSQFEVGGVRYVQPYEASWNDGDEKNMNAPVARVFDPGMEIPYAYDFGTPTELLIRVVGVRNGQPTTSHPIALMARNKAEVMACEICGKPATWGAFDGWFPEDPPTAYCDDHAEMDEDGSTSVSRICNSPRMGVCGYDGPAEPPY